LSAADPEVLGVRCAHDRSVCVMISSARGHVKDTSRAGPGRPPPV